jgi:hypothetical protein
VRWLCEGEASKRTKMCDLYVDGTLALGEWNSSGAALALDGWKIESSFSGN